MGKFGRSSATGSFELAGWFIFPTWLLRDFLRGCCENPRHCRLGIVAGAPVVSNVDYRNTGIILRVAPRINANGNVLLNIEQEISAVADNANANTLTPTVSQRRVASSIAVANGQTVLLAGLISDTQNRSRNGIPGLDKIPGVGELFSQNNGTIRRTELIIFIRPQIIRNGVDAYRVAAQLRDKIVRSRYGLAPPPDLAPRP